MEIERSDWFTFDYLNQMEIRLIHYQKENNQYDHYIPLNSKGNRNVFDSAYSEKNRFLFPFKLNEIRS